jgi:hypothetical protein
VREAVELGPVAREIRGADLQQAFQRRVDHLVVAQLGTEGLGAKAKIAVRARQDLRLQPLLVVLERGDHPAVGGCEACLQAGVMHFVECQWQVMLEEADVAGQLLNGDAGEDLGRVEQVRVRGLQRRGHGPLARDQPSQPLIRRRETALHDHEGAVGDPR